MNRRGFISLLAGSAGAVLIPWRQQVEPIVSLPPIALFTPRIWDATPRLVAVSGLELVQWPELREHLAPDLPRCVNLDMAFAPADVYRRLLTAHAPFLPWGRGADIPLEGVERFADRRIAARVAMADDLLRDWSKLQADSGGIWS